MKRYREITREDATNKARSKTSTTEVSPVVNFLILFRPCFPEDAHNIANRQQDAIFFSIVVYLFFHFVFYCLLFCVSLGLSLMS